MSAFILKDILALKHTIKLYSFIILVILVASLRYDLGLYSVFLAGMASIFYPLNSMVVDEKSNWNRFAITLPFGRSYIALSKYCFGCLSFVTVYLFVYICTLVVPTMKATISIDLLWGACAFILLYLDIMIPIALKFGTEKARFAILGIFYVPGIVVLAIGEMMGYKIDILALLEANVMWIPVVLVVLTALSIWISIRICETKDF